MAWRKASFRKGREACPEPEPRCAPHVQARCSLYCCNGIVTNRASEVRASLWLMGKHLPAEQEAGVCSLARKEPLERCGCPLQYVFGCAGSSLLLFSRCREQAAHRTGFSCGARALGTQASVVAAPRL